MALDFFRIRDNSIMLTFYHPSQSLHNPQSYFSRGGMRAVIEVATRLEHLVAVAHELGFEVRQPEDFGITAIKSVHSAAYLRFLESAHHRWKTEPEEDWGDEVMSNIYVRQPDQIRGGILGEAAHFLADGSCPIGVHTWQSAYWSAQSAIAGAEAINAGAKLAYALCRPPGHHARVDAAGGACYLNNAAIAANMLRKKFNRVAILDTDMHHGQGIQEIFYKRRDVLYVSTHGDPVNFYPALFGYADEQGEDEGHGFNKNIPIPHGASEEFFKEKLAIAFATLESFQPDAVIHAHGFDIYKEDTQSRINCSSQIFTYIGDRLKNLHRPCLIVQEGGYHLDHLKENARRFFEPLCASN